MRSPFSMLPTILTLTIPMTQMVSVCTAKELQNITRLQHYCYKLKHYCYNYNIIAKLSHYHCLRIKNHNLHNCYKLQNILIIFNDILFLVNYHLLLMFSQISWDIGRRLFLLIPKHKVEKMLNNCYCILYILTSEI